MTANRYTPAAMDHVRAQIERLHQHIRELGPRHELDLAPLLVSIEVLRARFEELRERPIRRSCYVIVMAVIGIMVSAALLTLI